MMTVKSFMSAGPKLERLARNKHYNVSASDSKGSFTLAKFLKNYWQE
jgi:hypothetical protein